MEFRVFNDNLYSYVDNNKCMPFGFNSSSSSSIASNAEDNPICVVVDVHSKTSLTNVCNVWWMRALIVICIIIVFLSLLCIVDVTLVLCLYASTLNIWCTCTSMLLLWWFFFSNYIKPKREQQPIQSIFAAIVLAGRSAAVRCDLPNREIDRI